MQTDADKEICIISPSNPQSPVSVHLFYVFLSFMMEELPYQKLISPCKLWIILPLILSGFAPQILISFSSVITFSFSTGTFLPAYKHALLLMFQNPFLVLMFPFSHHLFLYLSSQQNYEKSCVNLHLLISTHSSTHEEWKLPTFYWNFDSPRYYQVH